MESVSARQNDRLVFQGIIVKAFEVIVDKTSVNETAIDYPTVDDASINDATVDKASINKTSVCDSLLLLTVEIVAEALRLLLPLGVEVVAEALLLLLLLGVEVVVTEPLWLLLLYDLRGGPEGSLAIETWARGADDVDGSSETGLHGVEAPGKASLGCTGGGSGGGTRFLAEGIAVSGFNGAAGFLADLCYEA